MQQLCSRQRSIDVRGPELQEVVTHLRLLGGTVRAMDVIGVSGYKLEVTYETATGELPFDNSPAVQHEHV